MYRALILAVLISGCSTIPGAKHVTMTCPDGKSTVEGDVLPLVGSTRLSCVNDQNGGLVVATDSDISKPLSVIQALALAVIAAVSVL